MKVLVLEKVHNFVVEYFSIWTDLWFRNYILRLMILKIHNFLISQMTSMEKLSNFKL